MSRAIVTRKGRDRVDAGHPWIFRSDVAGVEEARNGDVVEVSVEGRAHGLIGYALYSEHSEITLRVFSRQQPSRTWIEEGIAAAIDRRQRFLGDDFAEACRLVHGESDGLPGLVVDRYRSVLVLQALTYGMDRRMGEIVEALKKMIGPDGILARNDPRVREREGLPLEVGVVAGQVPEEIEIREGRVLLRVDPWRGQKTGTFLDQRQTHLAFSRIARGRVLDAFCHDGGFALQAAAAGCEVTAVDISASACTRTLVNARVNQLEQRITVIEANAFDYLTQARERKESFDTIVLDPPAFAKNKSARDSAARGYKEINLRALQLLAPQGLLVTASCSHHISEEDFEYVLAEAARDAGRTARIMEKRSQPFDHPVLIGMPESRYIKVFLVDVT